MRPKNILITGGTGYFGSHLARRLLNDHNLIILKRKSSNLKKLIDIKEKLSFFEIENSKNLDAFMDFNLDLIIHCATEYGRKDNNVKDVLDTNLLLPLKMINFAKSRNIDFINIDTYSNVKKIGYSYLPKYNLTKKHFAEIAKKVSEKNNFKLLNLRLEHLYGPNDSESKFINWLFKECLRNSPEIKLTKGEQIRDFIYIDDAINALSILIKNINKINYGPNQIGLGTGTGISIKKVSEIIKKETKSSSKLMFGSLKYRDNEIMKSISNIEILNKLGWVNKISLNEGIKKMVNEFEK